MKFKYQKFRSVKGDVICRPIIDISLASKDGQTYDYFALIDSGADHCIFNAEIGELIGLQVKEGEIIEIIGINDEAIKVYFHDIFISVGGNEYPLKCGFSYELGEDSYGLLGQQGFFDTFKKVIFDYNKKIVELRPQ